MPSPLSEQRLSFDFWIIKVAFKKFLFVLIEDGAVDILKEKIILYSRMKFYD